MNHQPFEEWLLNDTPLTPGQQRDLNLHLKICTECASLAETGLVLRSVKMVAPAAGFTNRFQARLAERKLEERRRKLFGAFLFVTCGLGFLLWLAGPVLLRFLFSPDVWVVTVVEWGIFLATTLNAMLQAGEVLLHVVPGFVPPFVWMILVSSFAGIGLLWSVSIWRFARVPQGE